MIVEAGVTAAHRFQAIVEIEHHFVQRQHVDDHGARAGIGEFHLPAAAVLAQLQHRAQIIVRHHDGGLDPRLFDEGDARHIGHVGRVVQLLHRAVIHVQAIDDARRGGDKIDVEFAFQPLLDDLQMQETEEAAAKTEAQRGAGFHFVGEASVVQMQAAERVAQILELRGIDGKEAAEHHLLRRLESGQRGFGALALVGDGVADLRVGNFLDLRGDVTDFAGAELFDRNLLGREDADLLHLIDGIGRHHADLLALLQLAIDDAHQDHDAQIGVVIGIDQQRLQRRIDVAFGRGQARDHRFQHAFDVQTRLGGDRDRFGGVDADHILDLLLHAVRLGRGQVDLVEHRHDFEAAIDRQIDIGERLRFHALAGVHHQQRAFAGGEAARHLIAEVDMARRVHEIQRVGLAVLGLVFEAHGLRLDGDAALALDVHRVQHLLLAGHLARVERAGELDEPVGERRLAMVDMGDDGKVADVLQRRGHSGPLLGAAYKAFAPKGETGFAFANAANGRRAIMAARRAAFSPSPSPAPRCGRRRNRPLNL